MVVDEVVIDVADVAAVVNVVVVADVVVVVAVVAVAVVAVDDLGAPTPQPNNRAIISSNVLANFHNDKCSRSNFFYFSTYSHSVQFPSVIPATPSFTERGELLIEFRDASR